MSKDEKMRLPNTFRPIMWSYQFADIDIEKNKTTIIIQAINYGTLEHWRWINRTYGQETIRDVVHKRAGTALRKHVRQLAALLFGFNAEQLEYASRSSHP